MCPHEACRAVYRLPFSSARLRPFPDDNMVCVACVDMTCGQAREAAAREAERVEKELAHKSVVEEDLYVLSPVGCQCFFFAEGE